MRVELRDVHKSQLLPGSGFITLLAGIDLILESGSSTAISGVSGSGKTTLLHIMGGLARPTSGDVLLDGAPLRKSGGHNGTIAYGFQEPVFIPELTVMENLLLPVSRCREQAAFSRGELLLELFGLAEMFDLLPAALSTGEKQRLNLARALLPNPRLLLLDEPAAGLEERWKEKILELIVRQVRDTLATLVIASSVPVNIGAGMWQLRMLKGKVIDDVDSDN